MRGPRAEELRADGVERDAAQVRDFLIRELLVLAEHQHFAVLLVEPSERVADPDAAIGISGVRTGRVIVERIGDAMDRLAAIRQQHVVGDAEEERSERAAPFVARGAVEQGDEGVLGQLLGARRVRRPAAEEAPDRVAVAPEQRLERRPRAAPHLVHQLFVAGHMSPFNRVVSQGGEKFPSRVRGSAGRACRGRGSGIGFLEGLPLLPDPRRPDPRSPTRPRSPIPRLVCNADRSVVA